MNILVVSATLQEIEPLVSRCKQEWIENEKGTFTLGQLTLEFLITGVGMVRTAFALGNRLSSSTPDLCVNAGIAGAFPGTFAIGDVVHIVKDAIPEMGATDIDGKHLTMSDLTLDEDISIADGLINTSASQFDFLPKANGITVNTVHGDEMGISALRQSISPDVETMESAAFFYACQKYGVQFLAIRGISNIVEPRDRSKWDIPLAVKNLNKQLIELFSMLVG